MIFNSLTFLGFFAVVLALHHLPFPWSVKKFNLLAASYLFYAAWNPPFVLLLMLAAVVDFGLARALDRVKSLPRRRAVLAVSLVLNLGLLAYFKYGVFLAENLIAALGVFGVPYRPKVPSIILPLGISFVPSYRGRVGIRSSTSIAGSQTVHWPDVPLLIRRRQVEAPGSSWLASSTPNLPSPRRTAAVAS